MATATLITQTDFVGKYAINTDDIVAIQLLMDDTERRWLTDLLGEPLYLLLIANAAGSSGVPTTPSYLKIYNELRIDFKVPVDDFSTGMKEMLMAAVWFEWNKQSEVTPTRNGLKGIESSVSKRYPVDSFLNKNRYNLAVANYKVIQYYVQMDATTYGDIKYIHKDYIF
jgi:hypothetical protein